MDPRVKHEDDSLRGGDDRASSASPCGDDRSIRADDVLALLAEAGDAERHGVARLQVARRLLSHADARRRAGGDDVAALQAHEAAHVRSEEHTSELQSLMRISYAFFCLKNKK